ncbi:MAG: SpoIIE family protein phosphatase [Thermodesulfobacteriota bacterium]
MSVADIYQELFEHSPQGMLLIDPQTGVPVDCNQAIVQELGYSREEFCRMRLAQHEILDNDSRIAAGIQQALQTGESRFQSLFRSKAGRSKEFWFTLQIIQAENRNLLLAYCQVASQKQQTMQALQQAWINAQQAHRRLSQELQTMDELQRSIMPAQAYVDQNICAWGIYQPSGLAGGDYFDYLPLPEEGLRCVIADVSGHGARAAFVMAMVRTVFHFQESRALPLSLLLKTLNRQLMQTVGSDGDFVTLLAVDILPGQASLEYVNAGHCPGFFRDESGRMELQATSPLLGVVEDDFQVQTIQLEGSWDLLLYTDGLYECRLQSGDIFGYESFRELCFWLLSQGALDLERLPHEVARAAPELVGFNDDLTSLYVRGALHAKDQEPS